MVNLKLSKFYTHVNNSTNEKVFLEAENAQVQEIQHDQIQQAIDTNQDKQQQGDIIDLAFSGINFIKINRSDLSRLEEKFGTSSDKSNYKVASYDASKYINGWLQTMQNKINLSNADKNQDNNINTFEALHLNTRVNYNNKNGEFEFFSEYSQLTNKDKEKAKEEIREYMTTSDIINLHMQMDKNLDGKITTEENEFAKSLVEDASLEYKNTNITEQSQKDGEKSRQKAIAKRKEALKKELEELNSMLRRLTSTQTDTKKNVTPSKDTNKDVKSVLENTIDKKILKEDPRYDSINQQLKNSVISDAKIEQVAKNSNEGTRFVQQIAQNNELIKSDHQQITNSIQQSAIEQISPLSQPLVLDNSSIDSSIDVIKARIEMVSYQLIELNENTK